MTFTEFELQNVAHTVGKLCKRRLPARRSDSLTENSLRFVEGQDVTVYEERLRRDNPQKWTNFGIAKFKYNRKKNV